MSATKAQTHITIIKLSKQKHKSKYKKKYIIHLVNNFYICCFQNIHENENINFITVLSI